MIHSATALFKGLSLCMRDATIRKLAITPWLIGAFCYIASLVAAYYAHQPLLKRLVDDPNSWWEYIVYAGAWSVVSLGLLICTLIISIALTLILAGPFHSLIAEKVILAQSTLIDAKSLESSLVSEATRTVLTETAKLLWMTPIFIFVLLIGFIPILTPIAILLGAWLLAFQFLDIPLDVLKQPARKRIGFCFSHFFTCVVFGLTLTIFWAIPFLGIFLSPAATVGASLIAIRALGQQNKQ